MSDSKLCTSEAIRGQRRWGSRKQECRKQMSHSCSGRPGERKTKLFKNDSELSGFMDLVFTHVASLSWSIASGSTPGLGGSFLSDGTGISMRHLADLTEKNGPRRGREKC